jgi:hypothetical protein
VTSPQTPRRHPAGNLNNEPVEAAIPAPDVIEKVLVSPENPPLSRYSHAYSGFALRKVQKILGNRFTEIFITFV